MSSLNREQILTIIRALLIAIGGFLVGNHLFGHLVDLAYWDLIVGGLMSLVVGIWSWNDKDTTFEKRMAFVRSSLSFIGGIVISSGVVQPQTWDSITGLVLTILPIIMSNQQKKFNRALQDGRVDIERLKK